MPKVTVYRPNRTNSRYFTPCDVARIAWNCFDDTGSSKKEIIACVAKRFEFQVIALPTKDRTIPEGVQKKLDAIKNFALKLGQSVDTVNEWVTNLWSFFDVIGGLIPNFFKDDTKTIEDKVFAKTVGKVAARRVGWMFDLSEKLREKLLELKEDFIALQLDLEKVVGYIEAAEQLADFEIIKVSEQKNCNCNQPIVLKGVIGFGLYGIGFTYNFQKGRRGTKDKHTLEVGGSVIYSEDGISNSGEGWLISKVESEITSRTAFEVWVEMLKDAYWSGNSLAPLGIEWFT